MIAYSWAYSPLLQFSYLTPDRQLTALGKALTLVDPKYEEEIFMIIELVATGHLHSTPLHTQQRRPLLGFLSYQLLFANGFW